VSQAAKLFVGGLSYDTTDVSLQRYFEEFGEVESAVVLRDPATSRSRGFGFVTFVSTESANQVVASTRHLIDGRKVEAKFAVPRSSSSPSEQATSRSIPTPKSERSSSVSSPSLHYSAAHVSGSPLNFAAVTAGGARSPGNHMASSVRSDSFSGGDMGYSDEFDEIESRKAKSKDRKKSNGIISNKIFVGGLLYATHHGKSILETVF